MSEEILRKDVVHLSSAKFLIGCSVGAVLFYLVEKVHPFPSWLLAGEVFLTVIALFVFGSIRYRLDKNALTYGAVFVITATFWGGWWPDSELKAAFDSEGLSALLPFQWIKAMTPIVLEIFLWMTIAVYGNTLILKIYS